MADPKSVEAFQFIFEGKRMKELVDTNPTKIVCTVKIVEEITQDNRKVGALKIIAMGTYPEGQEAGLIIEGCPKPPCDS